MYEQRAVAVVPRRDRRVDRPRTRRRRAISLVPAASTRDERRSPTPSTASGRPSSVRCARSPAASRGPARVDDDVHRAATRSSAASRGDARRACPGTSSSAARRTCASSGRRRVPPSWLTTTSPVAVCDGRLGDDPAAVGGPPAVRVDDVALDVIGAATREPLASDHASEQRSAHLPERYHAVLQGAHAIARPVRVRIAPSPTGDPHVGTAYIALFNYVFAQQAGRQVHPAHRGHRPDRARAPTREQAIFDALRWVGLTWDEGPDVGGPVRAVPPDRARRASTASTRGILLERGHGLPLLLHRGAARRAARRSSRREKATLGYDRHCRDARPAEARRAAPPPASRTSSGWRCRSTGKIDVRRPAARRRSRSTTPADRRPGAAQVATASRPTTWPTSSTIT